MLQGKLFCGNLDDRFHLIKPFLFQMAFDLMKSREVTHRWQFCVTQIIGHIVLVQTARLERTSGWWVHGRWNIAF